MTGVSVALTRSLSVCLLGALLFFIAQFVWDVASVHNDLRSRKTHLSQFPPICVQKICSVNYDSLASSFIWSHRGHFASEQLQPSSQPSTIDFCTDASQDAMMALMSAGISNFDVDIILDDESGRFLVAHPVVWKKCNNSSTASGSFPPVSIYLDRMKSYFSTVPLNSSGSLKNIENLIPTISMEPKFKSREHLTQLIKTIHENICIPIQPLKDANKRKYFLRVAVVVHNVDTLHFVSDSLKLLHKIVEGKSGGESEKNHMPSLAVALAYRSQLLAPSDYMWTAVSGNRIIKQRESADRNIFIKKYHMPDLSLLKSNPVYPAPASALLSNPGSMKPEVVVWVVDSETQMCDALKSGADAVISNFPILLLTFLQDTHRKMC